MDDASVKTVSDGSSEPVLMTLDGVRQDPNVPFLHADDQAALRGDGIFETILVRDGVAQNLPAHLDRLTRSAKILDLPAPDLYMWGKAAAAAAAAWGSAAEGVLRLVLSRGRESVDAQTAFLSVTAVAERVRRARQSGASVVTLERGYSTELSASSWLPLGAKTLSYAVNMAAVRHAERLGVDDVIFVSAEGNVLEGPRSSVVIARGRELITPPPEQGILSGTTQRVLFQEAERRGFTCRYQTLRPADLITADGVWLLSSIALAVTVHTVNDFALQPAALDEQVKSMATTSD